jgi:uncharacterized membrane protein HdeD (DUF308 family)
LCAASASTFIADPGRRRVAVKRNDVLRRIIDPNTLLIGSRPTRDNAQMVRNFWDHFEGETQMTTLAPSTQQSSVWWLFLLQGIAAIILGLMLITAPGATLVVMVTFLGFFWLIEGILSLVHVFVDRATPWIWSLLTGIVGIIAGILVVRHPLLAALTVPTVLVILLGFGGLIMGAAEIVGGFTGGGIGSFILGVINVLIGLLLLSSPATAALAVPLVFGVLLLVEGIVLIIWAFRTKA